MISLFRGHRSWNVPRLAERFQCSRRNIHRDLALLELAGVPFFYDKHYGEGGGYRIRSGWFFPTVGLSEQECLDLAVLTRATDDGRGVSLLDTASEVLDKLLGTIRSEHQDLIRAACELFDYLNLRPVDRGHCRAIMIQLQKSLLARRQIEGVYRSPGNPEPKLVRLQPRRVFFAGQRWYAACCDQDGSETKLYQVARFEEVRVLPDPMTVEQEWSLREFLGNAWMVYRGDRDWHVEIQFDSVIAPHVAEIEWHHTQELLWQPDGGVLFRATVSGLDEVKYWVLGWGAHATVRKPKELIDAVCQIANDIASHYR